MPLRGLSSRVSAAGRLVGPQDMTKWVTFCLPGATSAADGTQQPPSPQFSCWASLLAIAGEELQKAQQIAQRATHLVIINYRLNVHENMLIQYIDGGVTRTFQIAAIEDPDEMRWQLKAFCFEIGQNAGGAS